jgi:hypothetical protein
MIQGRHTNAPNNSKNLRGSREPVPASAALFTFTALRSNTCPWIIEEERLKAESALKSLKEGAPAHQQTVLPAAKMRNAPSAYKHADKLMEAVKDWVAGGVVAGPFK